MFAYILRFFEKKQLIPQMSDSERQALEAGNSRQLWYVLRSLLRGSVKLLKRGLLARRQAVAVDAFTVDELRGAAPSETTLDSPTHQPMASA